MENAVSAVILGGELNGLGMVRSLSRQNINVTVVDLDGGKAAMWSRHAQRQIIRDFEGKAFVEDMVVLGKRFEQRPILFITNEDAVHSVSENRDELARWFRFRLPSVPVVALLSDKTRFHEFAQEHGFPVPRTAILRHINDLEQLADLQFPCVLKPSDKRWAMRGECPRAVRVANLHEARDQAAAMLRKSGAIVAQEWIAGPDSEIYFTLFYRGENGATVSIFTGRKLVCHPRMIGSTAVCIAAPEARVVLEAMTTAFAKSIDFAGMGSMEFKWNAGRQEFLMIEPTVGRSDWQEEIATLCGVNIALATYHHELGLPHQSVPPQPRPIAWRSSIVHRVPNGLLAKNARIVDGYFRLDDPLPAWAYYVMGGAPRRQFQKWTGRQLPNPRLSKQ